MTLRIVNYGGGTNSTALLVLAVQEQIQVHFVQFADTGSERPETYEYVSMFTDWLRSHEYPGVDIVRWIRKRGEHEGKFIPLHEWCENENTLPSKAFGLSGCTGKWKQQPADAMAEVFSTAAHASGEAVERWIGFDAGEPERAERMLNKNPQPRRVVSARASLAKAASGTGIRLTQEALTRLVPDQWLWRAPLVERDLDRDACVEIIQAAGLPLPGKSACWMCPSMKRHEIEALGREHPELLERSLKMEANAELTSIKGLGRSFSWGEYMRSRGSLPVVETVDEDCGCYDG